MATELALKLSCLLNKKIMYTIYKDIRSCRVSVNTIKALEKLIKGYLGEDSHITISIKDNFGEEQFSSFKDYENEYFQCNINEITLSCSDKNRINLVRIRLHNKSSFSDPKLFIELESKDRVIELHRKINDIFAENATMNWIIKWENKFPILYYAMTYISAGLTALFSFFILNGYISIKTVPTLVLIVLYAFIVLMVFVGFAKIPYINFKTKKTEEKEVIIKRFLWTIFVILLGLCISSLLIK